MRCRRIVQDPITGKQNIVWFGSAGTYKESEMIRESFGKFPVEFDGINPYTQTTIHFLIEVDNIDYQTNSQIIFQFYPALSTGFYFYTWNYNTNSWQSVSNSGGSYTQLTFNINSDKVLLALNTSSITSENYPNHFINYQTKVKKAIKIENYSEKQEAVRNSLIQRLSVIKGELWYKASYGLPLMDNIKNKGIYDSVIINIIMEHPDVRSIVYFNSEIVDHKYTFDFVVDSIYNEDVSISYEI